MFKSNKSKRLKSLVTCTIGIVALMAYCLVLLSPTIHKSVLGTKSVTAIDSSTSDIKESKKANLIAENKRREDLDKQVKLENEIKAKAKAEIIENQKKLEEASQLKLQVITGKIKEYLGDDYSDVSIDYLDLTTGKTLQINNKIVWHTASTIKVPVVMIILDMISEGSLKETDTMRYDADSDYESGTGNLQNMDKSQPFDMMMLCEYAIRYSDNIALNMLTRKIGYNSIVPKLNSILSIQWGSKPNQASAEMMTKVLDHLYLGSNPYYAKEIAWLKQTIFHDRLDKYIPSELVAHKVGEYATYVHDVGIIYADKPYILSVFSNNLDNPEESIAQISKIIYENR